MNSVKTQKETLRDRFLEDYGILLKVKRIKDNKRFVLDLASLKSTDKKSKNYMPLDDYIVWFVNNR